MLPLLLRYETWMIPGLVLIVLDVAFGLAFFALSFGVGAMLVGLGIFIIGNAGIFENWEGTVTTFGISSVLVLYPLRRWVLKTTKVKEDINHY